MSVTLLCNLTCVYQQRQIKISQRGREDMRSPHSDQKCTQCCCQTSKNLPFLVCSYSIINCFTHFMFWVHTKSYIMRFFNLTEHYNIKYKRIESTDHVRYRCRVSQWNCVHFWAEWGQVMSSLPLVNSLFGVVDIHILEYTDGLHSLKNYYVHRY